MRRMMIDIEAMGKSPDGVVLSVGLAMFDDQRVLKSRLWELCIKEQVEKYGRTLDAETALWWAQQPAELAASFSYDEGWLLRQLGTELQHEFAEARQSRTPVWALPPSYDLSMLRSLLRVGNQRVPWGFRDERCARTVRNMVPEAFPKDGNPNKHNAEADAVFQAESLLRAEAILGRTFA